MTVTLKPFHLALFAVLMSAGMVAAQPAAEFVLSTQCPPGFETREQRCYLKHGYQAYRAIQDIGVGGLKSALPPARDGFRAEQIDLGRYLFFDPILSGNGTQSCASCHDPQRGFADGRAQSLGANGKPVGRSAPSLWNVGFLQRFFWDGRAQSLEAQMLGPLYSPAEMDNAPAQLQGRLNAEPEYRRLFASAFPDATAAMATPSITLEQVYTALAAFESSLLSLNSRYDWYAHGVQDALNAHEISGLNVFRSFVARCAECHTPPLFSNQQIAVIGAPDAPGSRFDVGNEKISGETTRRGGFKVPTLRNIALTAPYEHSGAFSRLRDAVEFYNLGRGHAVPAGVKLQLHWHIWEPRLSAAEIDDLVAFLHTLTDESFKPDSPQRVPSGLPLTPSSPPASRMPGQALAKRGLKTVGATQAGFHIK